MSSISTFHKKLCCNIELTVSRWFSSLKLNNIQPKKIKLEKEFTCNKRYVQGDITGSLVPTRLQHYNSVLEYLKIRQCSIEFLKGIPTPYLCRMYKNPRTLYIIDRDVAGQLFKAMIPHLVPFKGHVLEVNAGIGTLTTYLLEAGIPRLRIYELDSTLYKKLQTLLKKYKSDSKLIKLNLLPIWTMIKQDRDDQEKRFSTAFEGITPCEWESDPVLKLIIAIPKRDFVTYMIHSVVFQSGIFTLGRIELLVIMPSQEYSMLTALPRNGYKMYKCASVMFQLIFEHTPLTSVPEKVFVPWIRNSKASKETDGVMNLVKITPQRNLFKKIPPHLMKPFWYFVLILTRNRTVKLIPVMEKWIPGIGVKLIAMGYNMLTPIGSLHPEEFLEIFMMFSLCSKFSSCSFLPAMESLMVKLTKKGLSEEIEFVNFDETKSEFVDYEDESTIEWENQENLQKNGR